MYVKLSLFQSRKVTLTGILPLFLVLAETGAFANSAQIKSQFDGEADTGASSGLTLKRGEVKFQLGGVQKAGSKKASQIEKIDHRTEKQSFQIRYGISNKLDMGLNLERSNQTKNFASDSENENDLSGGVNFKGIVYGDSTQVFSLGLSYEKLLNMQNSSESLGLVSINPNIVAFDSRKSQNLSRPSYGAHAFYTAGKEGIGEFRLQLGALSHQSKLTYSGAALERESYQNVSLISYINNDFSVFASANWQWLQVSAPGSFKADQQWTSNEVRFGLTTNLGMLKTSLFGGKQEVVGGFYEGSTPFFGVGFALKTSKIHDDSYLSEQNERKKREIYPEGMGPIDMLNIKVPQEKGLDDFQAYEKDPNNKPRKGPSEDELLEMKLLEIREAEKEAALRDDEEAKARLKEQRLETLERLKEQRERFKEIGDPYQKELQQKYGITKEEMNWKGLED